MKNKNITQYNKDALEHGYWEMYWSNGQLFNKGNYINGIMNGYWVWYDSDARFWKKQYHIQI